ncbi:hypothetical protein DM860_008828 [Cuscuta australis]|uniref:Uncharacterized protein n=1 Tax=Cuscuta australis TaxID=267555 RepID=A0A328D7Y6_9ASTE|nr:hypothetical protein DM860_008828 [Cuscuta australis]
MYRAAVVPEGDAQKAACAGSKSPAAGGKQLLTDRERRRDCGAQALLHTCETVPNIGRRNALMPSNARG